MEKNVRLRVLYVMELFVQQTDAENGVTMQEILDWLADHNLTGERKSIYEDIHALKELVWTFSIHSPTKHIVLQVVNKIKKEKKNDTTAEIFRHCG